MKDVTERRLILRRNGYLPIPVVSRQKGPLFPKWEQVFPNATEDDIRAWGRDHPEWGSTGIFTGFVVAIDIDCYDEQLADRGEAMVVARLGPTRLRRVGEDPKRMLFYRTVFPFRVGGTKKFYFADRSQWPKEKQGDQIEVIGAGNHQVVVEGIHPHTGKPYVWTNGPDATPFVVPASDLPLVTEEMVRGVIAEGKGLLRAAGGLTDAERKGKPHKAKKQAAAASGSDDEISRALLVDALQSMPNNADRADWVTMAHAIKGTLGEAGWPYWESWSAKWSDNDPVETRRVWDSITEVHAVKAGTIFHFAEEEGWNREEAWVRITRRIDGQVGGYSRARSGNGAGLNGSGNGHAPPPHDPETGEIGGPEPVYHPYSEGTLADTFAGRHKDEARYVHPWGMWMIWRDGCWREDSKRKVWTWAGTIVRKASADQLMSGAAPAAKASDQARTRAGVEKIAQSDPRLAASVEQWDTDPWILNTAGGIVDLKTGTARPHDLDAYCTRQAGVAPVEAMPSDCLWLRFLDRVCDGNRGLIAFLQRAVGYSLTGSITEECFFFLYGTGQNGKSKFIEAVTGILGDYHRTASMETFITSKHQQHPAYLAALRGARFVSAVEVEIGRRWNETMVKTITGGDEITAHFMRQNPFTFRPVLKLWIAGNHKPGLKNVDKAMRRRVNIVPFFVTIPELERDKNLSSKLRAEWPIVLRWAIDGCLDWQRRDGLDPPPIVTEATETYLQQEDTFTRWVEECCNVGKNQQELYNVLWESWKKWADNAKEITGSSKAFSQKLSEEGYYRKESNSITTVYGLSLIRRQAPGSYYD